MPLIIHQPGQEVGQVVTDPVGLIDVGPTVMEATGLAPIEGTVGRSLVPQMALGREPDRAIPTFLHDHAAIRKGRYRFIRYGDGTTLLYDLTTDWWQTRDLGPDHPAFAGMQADFAACCAEYGFTPEAAQAA